MGESLLVDGVTAINIDGLTDEQIIERIRAADWPTMCHAAYEQFKRVVDFDAEATQIKAFLESL